MAMRPASKPFWQNPKPNVCMISGGNPRSVRYPCRSTIVHPLKQPNKISSREITDPAVYFNRRNFIRTGILAASAVATGAVYRRLNHPAASKVETAVIQGLTAAVTNNTDGFRVAETQTSFQD